MNNEESNSLLPISQYGKPMCNTEDSTVNPITPPHRDFYISYIFNQEKVNQRAQKQAAQEPKAT